MFQWLKKMFCRWFGLHRVKEEAGGVVVWCPDQKAALTRVVIIRNQAAKVFICPFCGRLIYRPIRGGIWVYVGTYEGRL
jgi:hypothetical protein